VDVIPVSHPRTGREVHLVSRPHGTPALEDFAMVDADVSEPGPGQVLVRNLYISVDPYMRGRMNETRSYVPPFALGEVMDGGAVGTVVASASPEVAVGDVVLHQLGWREYALVDAAKAHRIDDAPAPVSAYLGVLGMPGQTAYVGLLDVAAMREGDAVFVSGASGAVGSLVGQIARLRGASRVVGSAGTAEKVAYLTGRLGFDAAFNYKDGPVDEQLAKAAPDGIDVYFDNVGGEHLEAALSALHRNGRVAMCGSISQYNAVEPAPGPRNLGLAVGKRLTLRGFIIADHAERFPVVARDLGGWLRAGEISYEETVVEGIDQAPAAFLGMLRGDNTGKMVVRVGA
jgi:NADPH-dependent curcumin reductase CurA